MDQGTQSGLGGFANIDAILFESNIRGGGLRVPSDFKANVLLTQGMNAWDFTMEGVGALLVP